MKKFIACMVALCLCFTMIPKAANANDLDITVGTEIPNAMVMMELDNYNCEQVDSLQDMQLVIKNDYNGEVVEVATIEDVQVVNDDYAVMVLGQSLDAIDDEVMAKLEVIKGELDTILNDEIFEEDIFGDLEDLDELGDVLESSEYADLDVARSLSGVAESLSEGTLTEDELYDKMEELLGSYKIEITGENAHYTVEDSFGLLITSDLIKEVVDIVKELLGLILEVDTSGVKSIADLVEVLKTSLDLTDEDLIYLFTDVTEETEVTMEELNAMIAEADRVLSFLLSESYNGTVFATGILKCDCPAYEEYYVDHYYYKVKDGKKEWIGFEESTYTASVGEVVNAADLEKLPVYNGETYEYVGSFDYWDEVTPVNEIVVGTDLGFVFEYVIEEESEGSAAGGTEQDPGQDPGNNNNESDIEKNDVEKTSEEKVTSDSPDTGDEMNLAAYIVAMIIAMGAMVVSRGRR